MQQLAYLDIFLWRALAIFLAIGALMGIAVALVLIFRPRLMARINRVANRWISTRHITQLLDRSVSIERWLYRHHRPLGVLTTLGACYILVYFGLLFDKAAVLRRLVGHMRADLLEILLDVLVRASLLGAAVALVVGLFFWLRPSLLRGVEAEANQWISVRRATRELNVPHDQVERFVMEHARRVGWLLLVGSGYLLFAMLRLLI